MVGAQPGEARVGQRNPEVAFLILQPARGMFARQPLGHGDLFGTAVRSDVKKSQTSGNPPQTALTVIINGGRQPLFLHQVRPGLEFRHPFSVRPAAQPSIAPHQQPPVWLKYRRHTLTPAPSGGDMSWNCRPSQTAISFSVPTHTRPAGSAVSQCTSRPRRPASAAGHRQILVVEDPPQFALHVHPPERAAGIFGIRHPVQLHRGRSVCQSPDARGSPAG